MLTGELGDEATKVAFVPRIPKARPGGNRHESMVARTAARRRRRLLCVLDIALAATDSDGNGDEDHEPRGAFGKAQRPALIINL